MKASFLISFLFLKVAVSSDILQKYCGNNKLFTYRLYWERALHVDGNFAISPILTQNVLTLAAMGAGEDTLEEIIKVAYLPYELPRVADTFSRVHQYLLSTTSLSIHNEIYTDLHELNYRYQYLIRIAFDPIITTLKDNSVDESTLSINFLRLSHGITFISHLTVTTPWIHKFLPYRSMTFTHADGREFDIDMVHARTPAFLTEDKSGRVYFIEFPFLDDKLSFTLVYPKKKEDFWDIEEQFPELFVDQTKLQVLMDIVLPDLGMFYGGRLLSKLKFLGINAALTNASDFSGLTDVSQKIVQGVQGTSFNISTIPVEERSRGDNLPVVNFNITHPFIFFLNHEVLGFLMIGRCLKPAWIGSNTLKNPFFSVW